MNTAGAVTQVELAYRLLEQIRSRTVNKLGSMVKCINLLKKVMRVNGVSALT